MKIVECPDSGCRLPAEVIDVWEFASTAGPVEHMKTRCVGGHVYTVATRWPSPEPAPIRNRQSVQESHGGWRN